MQFIESFIRPFFKFLPLNLLYPETYLYKIFNPTYKTRTIANTPSKTKTQVFRVKYKADGKHIYPKKDARENNYARRPFVSC